MAPDDVHLDIREVGKSFGGTRALRRRLGRDPGRLRSRLRRRERSRQVHARQDRRRGLPAGPGPARPARRAGRVRVAARGARAWDRARRPGGRASSRSGPVAENVFLGRRAAPVRVRPAPARSCERFERLVAEAGFEVPADADRRDAAARQAAAGRDPAGARPRRRADRVRRADGRAVGDRGPAVPRDRPRPRAPAAGRSSSCPTSSARCSSSPTPSPSSATARSSGPAPRPTRPRTRSSRRCSADRSAGPTRRSSRPPPTRRSALTVRDLTAAGVAGASLEVRAGEIVAPRRSRRRRPVRARAGDLRRRPGHGRPS